MRKELDEKLCKEFPEIFAQRNLPTNQTCMCWGFDCGDGWYDILYRLCHQLQSLHTLYGYQVSATQVKEKFGTLRFYTTGIFDDSWTFYNSAGFFYRIPFLKYKAKNALTRFFYLAKRKRPYGDLLYTRSQIDEIYDTEMNFINEAENRTYVTCEECGATDNVSQSEKGWIATLCDECHTEREKQRSEGEMKGIIKALFKQV